jgi:hypothetical protein
MTYQSPKNYSEFVLRACDKHPDPTGLNPLTLLYAAHVQELNRIANAMEAQVTIALKTLEAIQDTARRDPSLLQSPADAFSDGA